MKKISKELTVALKYLKLAQKYEKFQTQRLKRLRVMKEQLTQLEDELLRGARDIGRTEGILEDLYENLSTKDANLFDTEDYKSE